MAKVILFLLGVLAALSVGDGYKILVIFPIPARSHKILGDGVIRHLLNAGHEVNTPKNMKTHLHTSYFTFCEVVSV